MQVTPVSVNKINFNNFCRPKKIKPEYPQNSFSFGSISSHFQNIKLHKQKEEKYFNKFLIRKGKVTKEEYEDIVKKHPYSLVKAKKYCDENLKDSITPQVMATIVSKAHNYIKENYKNARIISIGTSPAPLCEQLALLGHDILFIPATGARSLDVEKDSPDKIPSLKYLIDYIKSKDLDDGKLNIVLDFTCTGGSLRAIRNLIKKYTNVKEENIKAKSLNDLLNKAFAEANLIEKLTLDVYFESLFLSSPENVSNVPHYEVLNNRFRKYDDDDFVIRIENKSEKEIFREFENSSQPLARAYSLCTAHEVSKIIKK